MEPEDLEPRKKPPKPKDLTPFSVEELNEYIAMLEAEIARARAAIGAKQAHRAGADSLFRK
jgi:uncharacterized small protein (DUF1192 family)